MSLYVILSLVCLLLNNVYGIPCEEENCSKFCQSLKLESACDSRGRCQCTLGESCSTMANTCELACKALKMDGECDENDSCKCSITPELCELEKCQKSCSKDPRAAYCAAMQAVACIEYGPVTFCPCICYVWPNFNLLPARQFSIMR